MNNGESIISSGILGENGDTFFIASEHVLPLDAPFLVDSSLIGQAVSVAGRMGIPPGAPGITKLLADKIIAHDAIAKRAFEIFQSGRGGSREDHWFVAERELLGF